MKKILIIVCIVVAVIIIGIIMLLSRCSTQKEEAQPEAPIDTMAVLIQKVEACSRLYTAEMHVHKIITHDDEKQLKGELLSVPFSVSLPFGDRKIAIPVDATIKAYVDMSGFSEKNVTIRGDKVEVVLPDPQIVLTHTKVDNEGIRKKVSLFRSDFTDEELTGYETLGRESIIQSLPKLNIIPMSREGAARILIPLLEQLGFKDENITITFRKNFMQGDLRKLIQIEE